MDNSTVSEEPVDQAEVPGVPPAAVTEAAAFTALTDLLAVIADPREHKRRLRGFHEALTAADAAQKNLVAASSEFEAFRSKAADDLAAREQAVRGREVAVSVAEENLRDRERGLIEQSAELRRQDMILRRRTMLLARLDAVDERMQTLPTWKQIASELLNAESLDLVDEMASITEQPAGLPQNSTLTRTTFHRAGRRSTRRLPAEA
jgi:hypothetical protein